MTAYKYRRGDTWYLGFSRNGVLGWKSTRSTSARVADDFLRRLKRGEAIPELSIPAEILTTEARRAQRFHGDFLVPDSLEFWDRKFSVRLRALRASVVNPAVQAVAGRPSDQLLGFTPRADSGAASGALHAEDGLRSSRGNGLTCARRGAGGR